MSQVYLKKIARIANWQCITIPVKVVREQGYDFGMPIKMPRQ